MLIDEVVAGGNCPGSQLPANLRQKVTGVWLKKGKPMHFGADYSRHRTKHAESNAYILTDNGPRKVWFVGRADEYGQGPRLHDHDRACRGAIAGRSPAAAGRCPLRSTKQFHLQQLVEHAVETVPHKGARYGLQHGMTLRLRQHQRLQAIHDSGCKTRASGKVVCQNTRMPL